MVKKAGSSRIKFVIYKMKHLTVLIFYIFIPVFLFSQDWQFDLDSLKDEETTAPMLLNPLIEGYTPRIDFSKHQPGVESGKVYNGFQVQVISVDNLEEAETVRDTLLLQISDRVEVVFDAPNYKVRAGAFTDRQDAERLRKQLYRLGYIRSWIVRSRLTY